MTPGMERVGRLIDLMQEQELSAILLQSESNIFYFSGYRGPGFMLIPLDGRPRLYVYPLDYEAADTYAVSGVEVERLGFGVRVENLVEGFPEGLRARLGYDRMEAESYLKLLDSGIVGRLASASEIIWKLRMSKDEEELRRIEEACMIASKCMELAGDMLADGVRESEIKAEILEEMIRLGAEKPSFDPIIATGRRSSMPHGAPGDETIAKGDVVVVDIGAVVEGYCSDITRTFYIGSNPPEEVSRAYEAVIEAKAAAEEAAKSWTLSSGLDEIARKRLVEHNLSEHFIHGLGHGVGIDIHEPPRLSPTSKDIIQDNSVITIEPGVYIRGRFGVRVEDTFHVQRDGVRRLTSYPYELALE